MSYAKMIGSMRRNPGCFGGKRKKKITLNPGPNPLDGIDDGEQDKPKSRPGPGTRVPPVFRPGTGPYNPGLNGNQFPGAGKKRNKPVLINRPQQPRAGGGRRNPGPDDWKRKKKITLNPGPNPLDGIDDGEQPKPKPKSGPGPGTRVPPVFRPGTGPYNPNQRRSRTEGRRGLSPMQRRNEQGLSRIKVR